MAAADRNDGAGDIDATTAQQTGNPGQLLFTPTQAAAALQVRESWLRRRAARRDVPCTFLGKHLRFSRADLDAIVAQAVRHATGSARGTRQRNATRGKDNEHIYTVVALKRWKIAAEKDMRAKVDGLDRLTEDRLNDMLVDATQNAKGELVSAIEELAEVSAGASELLRALFEKIESRYLDAESIALLHAASNRLGFLEEGSNLLHSASMRLGDFEGNAARVSTAASNFGR